MDRIEIINRLISANNYKTYLEIGIQNGNCFRAIQAIEKTGVDPDAQSQATIRKTSDDFFKDNKQTFDIIFIDGLHHKEQVIKDVKNSLRVLNKGGAIVMHDCLPTSKRMQEIPLEEQCEWTGDVWRAFLFYRRTLNLNMCVVDCDWGCGIIQESKQKKLSQNAIPENPTYEEFVANKQSWMNIITTEEFNELIFANRFK